MICAKAGGMPEEIILVQQQEGILSKMKTICPGRRRFFPEEEKMPLFRYARNYPLCYPDKAIMQFVDGNGRIDPEDAIRAEDFLQVYRPADYDRREMGYTLFPDGSGYVALYRIRPASITDEMEKWYRDWSCLLVAHTVKGHGNLRYKLGHPGDHEDKYYVNWTDATFGMYHREYLNVEGEDDSIRFTLI